MRYVHCILILASFVFFASCDKADENLANWGRTGYYSDFWWNHYEPVKMEQTLVLDFNDDARRHFTGKAVLELMDQVGERLIPTMDSIKLYKNGDLCNQNRLELTADDIEVVVGIEFTKISRSGNHRLFLVPVDHGGLDEIDQIQLENGFYAQKDVIMNPLAKATMWIVIVVLVLFVVWLALSRIINPYLKFSRISFDYNDGIGELSHRVGSCYKILCTNKSRRISVLHKIFVGKVYVEVNEFWTSDVTIMCGSRNNLRLITRGDYLLPDEPVRKEPFVIQNEQQRKVNIETT